jgi:transcriptional regulator with XRE-family HTH domain
LAIQANVDQSGLSKLERGKERRMGERPLRRISEVLGVTFEDLIRGTDFIVNTKV